MADKPIRFFIVAGERSGDLYASHLASQLQKTFPDSEYFGYGGDFLNAAGVTILRDYHSFSEFGISGVLSRLLFYRRLLNECVQQIEDQHIDCLILVDFSGFNLRLARRVVKKTKIAYFIAPKLWAWGGWRIKSIKKYIDLLLVTFPFEQAYFQSRGVPNVTYIGNPTKWLLNEVKKTPPLVVQARKAIGLLPGSRPQEIKNHLPVLIEVVKHNPSLQFILIGVDSVHQGVYKGLADFENVNLTFDQIAASAGQMDAAVVASGTATLELALLGVPQVVIYKTSCVTYFAARLLLRVKHISLVNILLGRSLVSELIQNECNAKAIQSALLELSDPQSQKKISEGYSEISNILEEKDPFQEGSLAVKQLMQL